MQLMGSWLFFIFFTATVELLKEEFVKIASGLFICTLVFVFFFNCRVLSHFTMSTLTVLFQLSNDFQSITRYKIDGIHLPITYVSKVFVFFSSFEALN